MVIPESNLQCSTSLHRQNGSVAVSAGRLETGHRVDFRVSASHLSFKGLIGRATTEKVALPLCLDRREVLEVRLLGVMSASAGRLLDVALEKLDDMVVALGARIVKWGIVPSIEDLDWLEALAEKVLSDLVVTLGARQMQGSSLVIVATRHVDDRGRLILHHLTNDFLHSDEIVVRRGLEQFVVQIFDIRLDEAVLLNREFVEAEALREQATELDTACTVQWPVVFN